MSQWFMLAGLAFVGFAVILLGVCMVLSSYWQAQQITATVTQMNENSRWIWRRFMALLEPHVAERVAELEALEDEMDLPREETPDPGQIRY